LGSRTVSASETEESGSLINGLGEVGEIFFAAETSTKRSIATDASD
jgi:hypothetical protein